MSNEDVFKKWVLAGKPETFIRYWHAETGHGHRGPEFDSVVMFIVREDLNLLELLAVANV
jgi:hypothetical protein